MSAQVAPFAQSIPMIDAARPELPAAEVIGALIGDAQVVALGEAAHNIVEFTALGDALLRELVQRHGVTAFVMESGFAEGLLVNEWIHGGQGDVDEISRLGITYRFGESDGIRRQLTWMREWNAAGGDVRFYGMDLPGSSTSPGAAVGACLARIPPQDGDEELLRITDLGERTEAAIAYAEMTDAARARLHASLRGVVARVRESSDEVAHLCADSIEAFLAELEWRGQKGPFPRERFIARAVEWIAAREERILVYAHDTHLRRLPLDGRDWSGALLSQEFGERMRVIGTTYGSGPVVVFTDRSARPFDCDVQLRQRGPGSGTIEEKLDAAMGDADAVLVDLRAAEAGALDGADGMLISGRTERVDDFPATFDALIHLRRVHPAPGAFERLQEEFDAPGRHA